MLMKKIMIVEDDVVLLEELSKFLKHSGYEILKFETIEDLFTNLSNIDMILLDINLPMMNGEQVLKKIRSQSNVPVIMLTSYNSELDEVLSMSYGADDYITKPYHPTILLLRIESIFKRMESNYSTLEYEGVTLVPDKCILMCDKVDYYLTKNEMLIFKYLIQHRGIIVSREDLMRYLWDSEEFIDDNTLSVNMSRLRNKLRDVHLEQVIETRKGLGYLLK